MIERDSAYWPDSSDPLGIIHAKEKVQAEQLKCAGMMYLYLVTIGDSESAERFSAAIKAEVGDSWPKALAEATLFLDECMAHLKGT
jgi:hypothetical protein